MNQWTGPTVTLTKIPAVAPANLLTGLEEWEQLHYDHHHPERKSSPTTQVSPPVLPNLTATDLDCQDCTGIEPIPLEEVDPAQDGAKKALPLALRSIKPGSQKEANLTSKDLIITNNNLISPEVHKKVAAENMPVRGSIKVRRGSRESPSTSTSVDLPNETETCLGKDFEPGEWDVVCGRGKSWMEFVSNRRFRILVAIYLREYFETISRTKKSLIIKTIVTTIQNAGGHGFVKKKEDMAWYRISPKEAREKVSHCLRDCLVDPQNEQLKWSPEQRHLKLKEAQDKIFISLELMV